MEKPAGTKNMGTWTQAVYTPEQQARLGVDETGNKVAKEAPVAAKAYQVPVSAPVAAPAAAGRIGLVGPAWTRGEIEKPAGTKDMGGWQGLVYTAEQQARLGVDEMGNKLAKEAPVAKAGSQALPAITPQYAAALLTSEKLLSDMCRKYFRKYDANKDGFLESDEVGSLCQDLHSGLGMSLTDEEIAKSMEPFSPGQKAGLSEEDFSTWFAQLLKDTVKAQVSEKKEETKEPPKTLTVKSLTGAGAALPLDASSTVADLAKEAATLLDLPVAQTKITCGGEVLADSATLEACQLDENSDLTAVVMNTIKVKRHVYNARGGAPPYRGYHLVATDEVELLPGKKLSDQFGKIIPDDGYPAPGHFAPRAVAFQSTPSAQAPRKWEGGMNEVEVDGNSTPEETFGVDGEVELAVLIPMRGFD